MPGTNPPYNEEFLREAVNLLISSGRPLKPVAEYFGISTSTLFRRLHCEVEYLRRQREILEKAMSTRVSG